MRTTVPQIGIVRRTIKQPQIGDHVLLVVSRQHRKIRRDVGTSGSRGGLIVRMANTVAGSIFNRNHGGPCHYWQPKGALVFQRGF